MSIYVNNQYDKAKKIIMRYPTFLEIINHENIHKGKINKERIVNNYNNLLNILSNEGVNLIFLNTSSGPSEVFTRDLGFIIKDKLFVCKLKNSHREKETEALIEFCIKNNIDYYKFENTIEGGDVFVHNNKIFVGISSRTSAEAIEELKGYLNKNNKNMEIVIVDFNRSKLHLDCVFNIIDESTALLSEDINNFEEISSYFKNVINMPKSTVEDLGINIFALNKKKVICTSVEGTKLLRENGVKVIYCEYDEIIKAGGGLTCSTMPLLRNKW